MEEEKGAILPKSQTASIDTQKGGVECNEDTATMERIFKSLCKVDFNNVHAELLVFNELQHHKEAVKLVINKASELLNALNDLKEETKTAVTETQQRCVQDLQSSSSSSSPSSSQNPVDMASTTTSCAMPSQPSDEAPALQQTLVTPIEEPVQELKQEQGLGLEYVPSLQQSRQESEATIELSVTQTCALADDELLDVGPAQTRDESMTETLLRCGGDVRTLLVNQPLSMFHSMTSDNAGKGAGPMSTGKQEAKAEDENGEEEELNERFVRPPRLRFALSKEAASDGLPSAIALSLRWHPDHMQDLPGDANRSIREAFDTKFDEYYVFRHWRPSQGK